MMNAENSVSWNETEELILKVLKETYGSPYDSMREEDIVPKIDASKKLYDIAVKEYRINQSAYNYNILITAMISLQYWTQKKSRTFSMTEDF